MGANLQPLLKLLANCLEVAWSQIESVYRRAEGQRPPVSNSLNLCFKSHIAKWTRTVIVFGKHPYLFMKAVFGNAVVAQLLSN